MDDAKSTTRSIHPGIFGSRPEDRQQLSRSMTVALRHPSVGRRRSCGLLITFRHDPVIVWAHRAPLPSGG